MDARRFEALVLPHADAAYNLALRLTRHAESAEDVTHDAYVAAMKALPGFRGGDGRAWILKIVRNRAYDWLRARRRVVPFRRVADEDADEAFDFADPDAESAEAALIRQGDAGRLHAALGALPAAQREVLVLREMEEMSYREIAEVTGAPIGSVMSRLARGRAALAALLAEEAA